MPTECRGRRHQRYYFFKKCVLFYNTVVLGSLEYHGTLDGNTLEIEIPQKNGKTKKKSYVVFDHKWRKLADI